MALSKAIYTPLFTETSIDVNSPFFHITPGEIALLQAFGFANKKDKVDANARTVPQEACLEMLLFKEGVLPAHAFGSCQILDMDKYRTELLAKETMYHNGCSYSLSACNNIMLLHIPGSYRLVMNDGSAVGNARVYLRVFTKDEFPWNSRFFIGE